MTRDLIGAELDVRFEAFCDGPDGGMDGRHAKDQHLTILQAKHYAGSSFSTLKSRMKREREAISKLKSSRYILMTSCPLSPSRKDQLVQTIGNAIIESRDIFGPDEINALLRKFPDIEKAHIKLWLTSAAILERIVSSSSHAYNDTTIGEIEEKLKVYVQNPSLEDGRKILEKNHILIVSGPPGVGKTTLAEMLAFAYISEGWDLNSIRKLDEGFSAINDHNKQLFLFDDFLGKVALDKVALSHKDSELYKFIKRISKSKNARFILTTRAYIFEEARRSSEYLSNRLLDISKYTLKVGIYTRRIKARILFNHLVVAEMKMDYLTSLLQGEAVKNIVDHENYNPRIIEWITDEARYGDTEPEDYPKFIINTLNNPHRLWDTAFRDHLSEKCQHLLFVIYFFSEYGVSIDELVPTFDHLHSHLCDKYGVQHGPKDFGEALKILEGSFVSIRDKEVAFINPSLKDYLKEYLQEFSLIQEFPLCAEDTDWAKSVWSFGRKLIGTGEDLKVFAMSFLAVAEKFCLLPVWRRYRSSTGEFAVTQAGMSNSRRIILLLEWLGATSCEDFGNYALQIARNPIDGFDTWLDGDEVPEIICQLKYSLNKFGEDYSAKLAETIENSYEGMLDSYIPSDDLERISDSIEDNKHHLNRKVLKGIEDVVRREFANIHDRVSEIDSESELEDYMETIKKLAKRSSLPEEKLNSVIHIIDVRIEELREEDDDYSDDAPNIIVAGDDEEEFCDEELINLFKPLLDKD